MCLSRCAAPSRWQGSWDNCCHAHSKHVQINAFALVRGCRCMHARKRACPCACACACARARVRHAFVRVR
eukprot:4030218-Pleurochrysis_carterae.AAC.1